jgi:hypothetical protein
MVGARVGPGTAEGRPRGWKLTPAARAVVGVIAIIGAVLALNGGAPSSDLFAYDGPVHTQLPDDQTVAQSSNAGALSGKDSAQSAQGTVAREPLVDLSTQASPAPLPAGGSGDVRKIQPVAGVSNPTPVGQEIDTSLVASLSSQPSSTQSPDLRPAQTISPTSRATVGAVETVRPSSPKLDMPTKRPGNLQTGSPSPMQKQPPPWGRQMPRVNRLGLRSQQSLKRQVRQSPRKLRPTLMARPFTDCVSPACPSPKLRRFAQE